MISIKKYLDMPALADRKANAVSGDLLPTALGCYRAILLAIGKSAVQGYSAVGQSLEQGLRELEQRLASDASADSVKQTETEAEAQLARWGERTAEHLKTKTDEVKELLIALARTAESVGSRDLGYATQFHDLTARLETIVDLEDLTEIRSSLVRNVTELKTSVEQMTRDGQQLVAQLRAKVSTYEHKLKEVEHLVSRDELTGLDNRRSVEESIQWKITHEIGFCILMLDLNGFKQVNDNYGHLAGDDLLKQFASELNRCSRISDMVGRWGGDEFIMIHESDEAGALTHVQRIEEWVFGKYNIHCNGGRTTKPIYADASIGVAQWRLGESMQEVIARADAAMYEDKQRSREGRGRHTASPEQLVRV